MTHHRDAGSGRYVTDEYAEQHPQTTVSERQRDRDERADEHDEPTTPPGLAPDEPA